MLSLDKILEQCTMESPPLPVSGVSSLLSSDIQAAFWVVMVNPMRQPPKAKFHSGHTTLAAADAEAKKQADLSLLKALQHLQSLDENSDAAKIAKLTTEKYAKRYYAIARPEDPYAASGFERPVVADSDKDKDKPKLVP